MQKKGKKNNNLMCNYKFIFLTNLRSGSAMPSENRRSPDISYSPGFITLVLTQKIIGKTVIALNKVGQQLPYQTNLRSGSLSNFSP